MAHAYNIVKEGSMWVLKTRMGGKVKSRHQTKANAKSAARSNLPVGSNVYVYYANKGGVQNEFTIRGN